MGNLKGQNLRVFIGTAHVLEATNCVITLTNNTSDQATKDDTGLAPKPTMTSQGWTIQVDSLDVTDIGTLLTAIKSKTLLTVAYDETSPTSNVSRLSAAFGRTGQAYITDLTINFNDREFSAKNMTLTGSGPLEKFSNN